VLGLAMGTSEAVGYVNEDNCLTGRLSELAFVPVDMSANAAIDEWSGDAGVGVKYLSQDGVIKLAEKAGISLTNGKTPAEKLKIVQKLAEEGDEKAIDVFRDVGVYLAYSLLYYREFYDFKNVLLMGRVMSGIGGETVIESAKAAILSEGVGNKFDLLLPDEKSRRLGQAVAASYLG
ncbi:MAG: ROK family protein, partial [Christensenellaceae bacterium]|nr:ROK family protein [Christensenellaceae bacterium]